MTTLLGHARRAAPRYTSYPTAPHFTRSFPETTYRDWLGGLDPEAPVSLYLHVPYCRKVCWYCGCNMKLAARYEPVAEYVGDLLREIDLLADALPARLAVAHLHWGGGTPTALAPDDLARVMERIAARFRLAADAELAIESDPRTLSDAMIETIGALGFNRASFGVQEFDPVVQAAINRVQPPQMVERAVEGLRGAGVGAVNFDLIYGLPHQTAETLVATIARAAGMRPDRIALFGYAHVPWVAKKQRMIDEAALPGPQARSGQAHAAAEALRGHGYAAIGLDHFALPGDALSRAAAEGRLRRNFQGYTTDAAATLIGLGATAIGHTPQGHIANIAETGAWARAVRAGSLPVARGHAMSAEDRLRARVIERLMCDFAVDLAAEAAAEGADPAWWEDAAPALGELEADGIVAFDGARLALTEAGRPLVRLAAAAFDRYLDAGAPVRHSAAV